MRCCVEHWNNKNYFHFLPLDCVHSFAISGSERLIVIHGVGLEKSNYSKVKDLSKTFTEVCKKLCNENKKILETLENIEPKNES